MRATRQAPKAFAYHFKMKPPNNDSVALQFNAVPACLRKMT